MGLITWLVVGLISGWLASIIMKSSGGVVMDIIMGVIGAFVGGFVMNLMGQDGVSGFNPYSIAVAVVGACIVIFIGRQIRR
jgi:uncharacterized membrane protein YeaQ/YmgE (transglycosylase-associated protein family)